MSIKTTVVIGVTVIGIAVGATQLLTAPPQEVHQQQRDQQVQDLSDADERSKATQKENGDAAAEAERRQKLKPIVPTVNPKPKPKIRIRVP